MPADSGAIEAPARKTKETEITANVDLDGTGAYDIATGIGFLDHMLEQLARHGLIDIKLEAKGDLHIDFHHTAEDSGIVLGQAIAKALGDKSGITRYADVHLPMDETLTRVAVDVSGRPYLIWKVDVLARRSSATWTPSCSASGSRRSRRTPASRCTSRTSTARTTTTSPRPASRVWRGRCGRRSTIDPRQAGRVPSTKGTSQRLTSSTSCERRHGV